MLDVRVHVAVLCLLVLNEIEQALVDRDLKLLVIISVLNNLVDGILEVVDIGFVVPDDFTVSSNSLSNQSLTNTEILNHEAERSINRVIVVQLLVKRLRPFTKAGNLELFRGNILPEISDLLIKNELELLKLLGLFLQMQDGLLPLVDDLVLDVNLRLLLRPLNLELLDVGTLFLQHCVLVLDKTIEGLELLAGVSKFVLCELDLTL